MRLRYMANDCSGLCVDIPAGLAVHTLRLSFVGCIFYFVEKDKIVVDGLENGCMLSLSAGP